MKAGREGVGWLPMAMPELIEICMCVWGGGGGEEGEEVTGDGGGEGEQEKKRTIFKQ